MKTGDPPGNESADNTLSEVALLNKLRSLNLIANISCPSAEIYPGLSKLICSLISLEVCPVISAVNCILDASVLSTFSSSFSSLRFIFLCFLSFQEKLLSLFASSSLLLLLTTPTLPYAIELSREDVMKRLKTCL